MLHDTPEDRARDLSVQFKQTDTKDLLTWALAERQLGRLALVSSFGTEAAVLLHLVATINPATPVLFIDTLLLFPETLEYQKTLSETLGLRNLITINGKNLHEDDPHDDLNEVDPDMCCHLRKTRPLNEALRGFDSWISGRKRFQGGRRQELSLFEVDHAANKLKINPLAHWTPEQVHAYFVKHNLPQHPLVMQGYGSVGCTPCTIAADGRTGRWLGRKKTECGIHLPTPHNTSPTPSERVPS